MQKDELLEYLSKVISTFKSSRTSEAEFGIIPSGLTISKKKIIRNRYIYIRYLFTCFGVVLTYCGSYHRSNSTRHSTVECSFLDIWS